MLNKTCQVVRTNAKYNDMQQFGFSVFLLALMQFLWTAKRNQHIDDSSFFIVWWHFYIIWLHQSRCKASAVVSTGGFTSSIYMRATAALDMLAHSDISWKQHFDTLWKQHFETLTHVENRFYQMLNFIYFDTNIITPQTTISSSTSYNYSIPFENHFTILRMPIIIYSFSQVSI